jgi:hypothetical protein
MGHESGASALSLGVDHRAAPLLFCRASFRVRRMAAPGPPTMTRPTTLVGLASSGLFSHLADALLRGIDLRFLRLGALLSRASLAAQIESRVDQADMAVRLGKIAKHSASERIKLFGEQTHVVAPRQ